MIGFPVHSICTVGNNAEKIYSSLMDSMLRIFTGGAGLVGIDGTGKLEEESSSLRNLGRGGRGTKKIRASGIFWGKKRAQQPL